MDTVMHAVFVFTCLLGTSLQADHSTELSGALCAGGPGLWPVPTDCSSFVLCVSGSADSNATASRLLRCPPHTAFSAELTTCVPSAQVVGCGEQIDEESSDSIAIHMPSRQRRAGTEEIPVGDTEESCDDGVLGPICADCDQLLICAQIKDRFVAINTVSCSSTGGGQICSGNKCTSDGTTCEVPPKPLPFRCLETGIFPDPEDCRRYHLCGADLGHISDKCGERYDPDSRSCMDNPKEPKEPTTLPPCVTSMVCSEMGEVHPVAHAPGYYALCLPSTASTTDGTTSKAPYQITVLSCPEGQLFDDKSKKCRPSCGSRRGRLPVEGDCRAYTECSSETARPRRFTCSRGLAFDAARHMCLPESQVAACPKSITRPPGVTSQGTTAPTPAQQVVSSPSQATPVTPAVINIPLLQHPVCITEGRFTDSSDCRRYVHCWRTRTGALTMALRWCPPFTYFDQRASACLIGFC